MKSTRERIKEIALKLFAEKGYEGTALSEIASSCKIKTPSLYGHYTSKEQLFLEVWADLLSNYRDHMENLLGGLEGMPVEQQAYQLVEGYSDYFTKNPDEYKLWARLLMFPPPQFKDRIFEGCMHCERSILERISQFLSQGVERGEIKAAPIEDLLAALLVLKEGYVQCQFFYDFEPAREQGKKVWSILWKGLQEE